MLWFFFDTSAIVKRYHREKGDDVVDKIIDSVFEGRHRGIVSTLVILEFVSASRRKVSSIELSWEEFTEGITSFLREVSQRFILEPVDSSMYTDAINFVVRYGLNSSDSVHLVSLSKISETLDKSKVILVSSDKRLCESAEQEGLRILNPERVSTDDANELLKE